MSTRHLMLAMVVGCGACSDDGSRWCDRGGGSSDDIVVGDEVVAKVCYDDATGDPDARVVSGGDRLPPTDTKAVIGFDTSTDGRPIEGNVNVTGADVTIDGNGADKTILDGNLVISGRGAHLRGVTVVGNLFINDVNAAIIDCVIRGNVEVNAEGTLLGSSDVYGNVVSRWDDSLFVANRVQGNWSISGAGVRCEGNRAFSDGDDDFVVDASEVGAVLGCE